MQDHVKKIMSEQLLHPSAALSHHHQRTKTDHFITKPSFIASCSAFGPKVCLKLFHSVMSMFIESQLRGVKFQTLLSLDKFHEFHVIKCWWLKLQLCAENWSCCSSGC